MFSRRDFPGLASGALAFAAYLATLAPSVGSMDAGELAAAAHVLGVAHPPGSPLYLLVAKAFSLLPIPGAGVLLKLNLLGALLCGAAVFLLHRFFERLLPDLATPRFRSVAAAGAALALAFSRTFWAQGTSAEVYALHLVFLAALLLLFFPSRADSSVSSLPVAEGKRWLLFAYMTGLSFSNHMMTVLLAPALLYAFFAAKGLGRAAWGALARAAVPFLLGLSVYLCLPLRAATRPLMNWGDPSTWEAFVRHVTAAQFREWMFASPEVAARGLGRFAAGLPFEFALLPLLAAACGLYRLRAASPFLFRFSLLLFGTCVLYAASYDIPDVEAYFLQAHAVIALWAGFGLLAVAARAPEPRRGAVIAAGACLLALVPLAGNWRASDRRGDFAIEDYARNVLGGLPPNALLLSDASSAFYFTASWLQFVEGFRPDVAVVGYRALAFPWHLDELETRHPGLLAPAAEEAAAYRREKARFDAAPARARDSAAYAGSFVAMTRALLRGSFGARPVYITPDVSPALIAPWRAAPDGLALRLFAGDALPDIPPRDFSFRPLRGSGSEAASIRAAYAAAYCYQGVYQALRGDTAAALRRVRKSLEVLPGYAEAQAWQAALEGEPSGPQ